MATKTASKKVEAPKRDNLKTQTVLKMVENGKTRKEIIDKLVSLNPEVSRKSNAGLVCHIFKRNSINSIPSGVKRGAPKKQVKVKSSKKVKA